MLFNFFIIICEFGYLLDKRDQLNMVDREMVRSVIEFKSNKVDQSIRFWLIKGFATSMG